MKCLDCKHYSLLNECCTCRRSPYYYNGKPPGTCECFENVNGETVESGECTAEWPSYNFTHTESGKRVRFKIHPSFKSRLRLDHLFRINESFLQHLNTILYKPDVDSWWQFNIGMFEAEYRCQRVAIADAYFVDIRPLGCKEEPPK